MRYPLLILLNLFSLACWAQNEQNFDTLSSKIDSLYFRLHHDQQKKDTVAIHRSLDAISKIIEPIEPNYPLIAGIVQLHQFFYATHPPAQEAYRARAMQNLQGLGERVVNEYSSQMFWLIEGFNIENRLDQWMPVDNLLRKELYAAKKIGGEKYIISLYANELLKTKQYKQVSNLARYEEIYFNYIPAANLYDKLNLIFAKWLQVKQELDQWLGLDYTQRTRTTYNFNPGQVIPDFLNIETEEPSNYNFKAAFEILFDQMKKLRKEALENNKRSNANYQEGFRSTYYSFYNLFVQNYYLWAVKSMQPSEAILPVKKFLIEDLLEEELADAKAAGKPALISLYDLKTNIKNLASLYYEVGNPVQSNEILLRGQDMLKNYPGIRQDEYMIALIEMMPYRIQAARLEGDFSRAENYTRLLKNLTASPDSLISTKLREFEWFGVARVEEVFNLIAQKNQKNATDSLIKLIDHVSEMPTDDESLIYNTRVWVNLQYLTSLINAQRGKWNPVLLEELIADLLTNDLVSDEIFYPSQLLAFKAIWFESKKLHLGYLQNLLFYTGHQLQNNFQQLSAEERMQLYARSMNDYFDLYHELLFTGALDTLPEIKQDVLSQSLYLKNALADGNIIPDEVFLHENKALNKELLDKIRALRQVVKNNYLNARLFNRQTGGGDLNDQMQTMWLSSLNGADKSLLQSVNDWQFISKKIKPGQIYMETVRYNRWLSDSTVMYGVYLIDTQDQIHYMNLCTEKDLADILNQPGSSPQTSSLTGTAKRGNELLGKSNKKPKTFQPGDTDLLGELLINPIAGYLKGKNELFMVHDGLLNRISFAALQYEKKYLMSQIQLHQMSGSNELGKDQTVPGNGSSALLAGGLNYGEPSSNNPGRLFLPELQWQYLPGTKQETEMLEPLFKKSGYTTKRLSGNEFTDSLSDSLGRYQFIHLATHGFYYDSITANQVYDAKFNRDAMQNEPLFRSGLAISAANNPSKADEFTVKGYLMGYELANIDLRNCFLISLSACETGLGDLRNNLGVDGLSRALKIAGAKNLLISLWKVPDEPTAVFMQLFYTALFSGKAPSAALQETQLTMSKSYPASAWAAFILVE